MENIDNNHISEENNEDVCIDVIESLACSVKEELAALANDTYTVCIFRVFEKFRKSKEEFYTPRLVSIGPLHHGKSNLQAMEAYKLRYLQNFIFRFGIPVEKLITYASNKEGQVRGCYEDTLKFKSKEFCKMILLDGIFVVHLFMANLIQLREPGDMLFENPWMARDLMHDMLLLENQLPLNFILGLFDFVDSSRVYYKSFHDLSLNYFKEAGITKNLELTLGCESSRHLMEFLIMLHTPPLRRLKPKARMGVLQYTPSASELQANGVRFDLKNTEGAQQFEVSFADGMLKLSQLTINDETETFFRNLMAFEQCGHYLKYITSYVIFMQRLIKTADDEELLVKHRVIDNSLGKNQLVADLFNNLSKEVVEEQKDFYFAKICNDLSEYKKKIHDEANMVQVEAQVVEMEVDFDR